MVISSLMVLSLVLASCAQKVTEEEKKVVAEEKKVVTEEKKVVTPEKEVVAPAEGMVTLRLTKKDGTVVEVTREKPRYGGVLTYSSAGELIWGNPRYGALYQESALGPTHDTLTAIRWDWGPAGTREWDGLVDLLVPWGLEGPELAESYEVIPPDTIKFRIRRGVRFALDPTNEDSRLVGGRELTPADVVYSLIWAYRPGTTHGVQQPYLADMVNREKSVYVDPADPWTVVVKGDPKNLGGAWETVGGFINIKPPELLEKYGELTDHKKAVGTGPFIATDWVRGSIQTYKRNPNYWKKNPLHPEDQLPYVDRVQFLAIPDTASSTAALRTGKIDIWRARTGETMLEDAKSLWKTNPELKWVKYLTASTPGVSMRTDRKPFNDIRVRQALQMAINQREMVDSLYGGEAEINVLTIFPIGDVKQYYVPLEKYPESVQELFTYKPDKAKKLLAEAGYPTGLKTEIVVSAIQQEQIDVLSVVKDYWAKIGVDLSIRTVDPAVFSVLSNTQDYDQMLSGGGHVSATLSLWTFVPGNMGKSRVNEPWINQLRSDIYTNYFSEKRWELWQAARPRLVEESWYIQLPNPYNYHFWQPWLKDYNGVLSPGQSRYPNFSKLVWIDQELKQKMTGRR